MRILHISATNILATKNGSEEMARRRAAMQAIASPGTTVHFVSNPAGPLSIETDEDERAAVPGMRAALLEAEGYDAVTLGCFGDPGLAELRSLTPLPVLGPGISAMHAASLVSDRFSILSPVESSVRSALSQAEQYGLAGKVASVRALNIPVLTIRQDRRRAVDTAVRIAAECIEKDGADAIVLGCMSMAFQRLDLDMVETIRVRVINPLIPLVRFAETLALSGVGRG